MTDGEKLLLWSVYYVADNDIRRIASGEEAKLGGSLVSGNTRGFSLTELPFTSNAECDMTKLSYYPVDIGTMDTKKLKKVIFANDTIEAALDADLSTRSATQHYLMHCGLFRNVSGDLTVSNELTLQGKIGCYSASDYTSSGVTDNGSGALICGTMTNNDNKITLTNGSNNLILNSLSVANLPTGESAYAPLLINKISTNTAMELNNVSQSGYTGSVDAATSLIGDVGSSTAQNIELNFSGIKLDSRKSTSVTALNDVYSTTKSIFTKATLLNKFEYESGSRGTYNYTVEEDWGTGGTNGNRAVTYGYEVTHSTEYANREKNYLGSDRYTNPTSYANTASDAYGFSSADFLPYVATAYNSDKLHELKVNLSSSNLVVGCGRYNDPYIISRTDSEGNTQLQLDSVASIIISGTNPDPELRIVLPDNINILNPEQMFSGNTYGWCSGNDFVFKYDNGNFVSLSATELKNEGFTIFDENDDYVSGFSVPSSSVSYTQDVVRKYLAGAYYKVISNIELSQHFDGLGASSTNGEYAFRGVIVGDVYDSENEEFTGNAPTITNSSTVPLISISNGSVIKNIELSVEPYTTITLTENPTENPNSLRGFTYDDSTSCNSYGSVIGRVMGGDNIIDKVDVSFSSSARFGVGGDFGYLVPVGGYIGVVLDGGVFFRNMGSVVKKDGLTAANLADGLTMTVGSDTYQAIDSNNTKYLYINPIIGRVINGFAVTETTSAYSGTTTTMDNGTKNYSIADITNDSTGGTLTVNNSTSSITAPTAQSWFVLSALIQSGLMTNGSNYVGTGTGNAYKTRHCGTYAEVGVSGKTTSTVCDSVLFGSDYVEQGNVAPYILSNTSYTNGTRPDSSKNYAITMGTTGSSFSWTLPKGYRGIGGFLPGNNTYNIKVSSLTTNGTSESNSVINLNMKYQSYSDQSNSNHSDVIIYENYLPVDKGFGLFNTFTPSQAVTVSYLTLAGTVYVDMCSKDDGSLYTGYGSNNTSGYPNNNQLYYSSVSRINTGRISAGMFAGKKTNTSNLLTLSNVSLNGITVHSSRWAGGFFGFGAYITISDCPATNISVLGRYDTGGLIGYAANYINILGNTTSNTTISIDSVIQDAGGFNFKTSSARNSGLGGIIGRYGWSYNDNITGNNANNVSGKTDSTTLVLSIKNLSLTKYGSVGKVAYTFNSNDESPVGGIIGGLDNQVKAEITDCSMEGVSVVGIQNRVGGIIGGTIANSNITLYNLTLDGTGATYGIQVDLRDDLGGVVGHIGAGTININNTTIKNYAIQKVERVNALHNNDVEGFIGGCIGRQADGTSNIRNFTIENCSFAGYCRANGCGGIVGTMSKGSLLGYNIVENGLSSGVQYLDGKDYKSAYGADIVGSQDKRVIKIVGFSRHNNTTGVATLVNGNHNTDTANYYVVCSDFGGDCITNSPNTVASTVNVTGTAMENYSLSPYALINPVDDWVDGQKLTGDGYADTIANLAIDDIIAAKTTNSAYADVLPQEYTTFDSTKLTMFRTEFPDASDTIQDFPLLILDNTNPTQLTAFINSYLRLLTNTNYNFAEAKNAIYKVNNEAYRYDSSAGQQKFRKVDVKKTSNPYTSISNKSNLLISNNQFSMSNEYVDNSPNIQFTLLDIQFKDPTVSGNVAYHLYIPVLVKKLMQFDFEASSNSGTLYESDWYTDVIENAYTVATPPVDTTSNYILETLGTPVTMYFKYTYRRTDEEWQRALEGGENLTKSFAKTLQFSVGAANNTNYLSSDTKFVLVDNNRGNKVYYNTNPSNPAFSASVLYNLPLSSFTDAGSNAFVAPSFSKLLGITATIDDDGLFVVAESTSVATAEDIDGNIYRLYKSGDEGTRYSLSIDPTRLTYDSDSGLWSLEESYYLSIFTTEKDTGEVYHYTLQKVDNFGDVSFPTKINNFVGTEIYIGDLFEQSFIVNSKSTDSELIMEPSSTINAELNTTISAKNASALNVFRPVMERGYVTMYHSFLVSLVMKDQSTLKGIIVKSPDMTPSATYKIGSDTYTPTVTVEDNYVSIMAPGISGNLASQLASNGSVSI